MVYACCWCLYCGLCGLVDLLIGYCGCSNLLLRLVWFSSGVAGCCEYLVGGCL